MSKTYNTPSQHPSAGFTSPATAPVPTRVWFGPSGPPQYREFYGRGEFRWAIYPATWKESWGRAPLLGIVAADDEFLAERLAYDKGILNPHNCTFQPRFKNLGANRKPNESTHSIN